MAFDHQTGRLWAGDVGNDTWEEVNIIERGGNYGWNINEGFHRFKQRNKPTPPLPARIVGRPIEPVFAYNHSVGNCVIGGCVYRGTKVPELSGAYIFADHVTGQVFALRYEQKSARVTSVQRVQPATMPIFSFGEDESGEVYFTTIQGIINRFVSVQDNNEKN
jgi:glucose/arabinose dehydrogenase